jgi:feruloyl-CoA synthase
VAQDIVVAGHDRDTVSLLIFPNAAACKQLAGLPADGAFADALNHEAVRNHVTLALDELRRTGSGTSTFAQRALLMTEPPAVDGGEITDKGYINQAAVLKNRAHLVDKLYAITPDAQVICL